MELTSLYQRNDPRHETMLSKTYNEAKINSSDKIKQGKGLSKYKKRGEYNPPESHNIKFNDVISPVMCISSIHPHADSNGRFVEEPMVITGHRDGSMGVYAMRTMNLLYTIAAAKKSGDESTLDDKRKTRKFIKETTHGHSDGVMDLLVYQPPEESLLVIISASMDTTVQITNLHSGKSLGSFEGHTEAVWSVDVLLHHDLEPIVVSGSLDGSICIWSMIDQTLIRTINCSAGAVFKASIFCSRVMLDRLANGSAKLTDEDVAPNLLLLVSSEDRTCSLWNLTTGMKEITYDVHPMRITDCTAMIPAEYNFHSLQHRDYEDVEGVFAHRHDIRLRHDTTESEKSKRRKRDWEEYCEDETDDMYFLQKFALVITACADGKLRMIRAESGVLLRTFVDPTYAPGGEFEGQGAPSALCLGIYAPISQYDLQERKNSVDRVSQSSSGTLSRRGSTAKRDFFSVKNFGENITENVVGGFEAIGHAAKKAGEFISYVRGGNEQMDSENSSVDQDPKILAGYKNGIVLSFDIATGQLYRSLSVIDAKHGDDERAITCLLSDDLTQEENMRIDKEEVTRNGVKASHEDEGAAALPLLFVSTMNKKLYRRRVLSRFIEAQNAYNTDKDMKVPREWASKVPIEFRAWPRVYLLAQRFGGLKPFFAGPNFSLFSIALREGNVHFFDTFIGYIDSGLVLSQRAAALEARARFATTEKELWDREYDYKGPEIKRNGGICSAIRKYLFPLCTMLFKYGQRVIHYLKVILRIKRLKPIERRKKTLSILRLAIELEDVHATRRILDVWIGLLSRTPHDLIDQTAGPARYLSTDELVLLAEKYPGEFLRFLEALKPVVSHDVIQKSCTATLEGGKHTLFRPSGGHLNEDLKLWAEDTSTTKVKRNGPSSRENLICFYLPLCNPCAEDLVLALTSACEKAQSVDVFKSPIGMRIAKYLWHGGGKKYHTSRLFDYVTTTFMIMVLVFMTVPSYYSDLDDPYYNDAADIKIYNWVNIAYLFISSFTFVLDLLYSITVRPDLFDIIFNNFWMVLDVCSRVLETFVIFEIATSHSRECLEQIECQTELRLILACFMVVHFSKILYFMRAFESTGLLVALVFESGRAIILYVAFIFVAIVAFAQLFYTLKLIVSYRQPASDNEAWSEEELAADPWSAFSTSVTTLISWVVGGFAPNSLVTGLYVNSSENLSAYFSTLGTGWACGYQLIVATVTLNLLIASMSDSFVKLNAKGQSEWRLMQVQTVREGLYKRLAGYKDKKARREINPKFMHFANRAIDLSDQEVMRGNDEGAAEDHERKIQAHRKLAKTTSARIEQLGSHYADLSARVVKALATTLESVENPQEKV